MPFLHSPHPVVVVVLPAVVASVDVVAYVDAAAVIAFASFAAVEFALHASSAGAFDSFVDLPFHPIHRAASC